MDKDGWKTLAIVFIVLSSIFFLIAMILGAILLFGAVALAMGENSADDSFREMCGWDICSEVEDYSYYIVNGEGECICLNDDGEALHRESLAEPVEG